MYNIKLSGYISNVMSLDVYDAFHGVGHCFSEL